MRIPFLLLATATLVTAGVASLSADRVKLRSGQTVSGSFMSADVKVVRLLLDNGRIAEFPVDEVGSVEFTPRKSPPAPAPDPAKTPPPVTVPTGTVLSVRLTQAIEVDAAQAGQKFKSVLDDPVMLGGVVVLARGAAVVLQAAKVEQAGAMKGADKIALKRTRSPSAAGHADRDRRRVKVQVKARRRPARSAPAQGWAPSSAASPAEARARRSARRPAPRPGRSCPARARNI
jgi:hypothetical protein